MIINKNKSGIIDIQKRHDRFKKTYEKLDGIKIIENYKYLGMLFSEKNIPKMQLKRYSKKLIT